MPEKKYLSKIHKGSNDIFIKDADARRSILNYVKNPSGTAGSTASGSYNRTQWTGDADEVTSLYTGLTVLYKIPIAGVKYGVTLNINNLGEHPVVINVSTIISTSYAVGVILPLVYDADQKASVYINNTNTNYTGCWKIANYDSNTTYVFADNYNKTTNLGATVSTVNKAVANATQFSTAYIGAGASASAVAVAANLKNNLRRGAKTSVTASSNKLWILTPSTYADPTVLIGGIEVPMTAQSNTTVSGVTYKVWNSNNTYTGTFNVILL